MPKTSIALKHSTILATYLLIVWGLYRTILIFPEEVEELFIKPILWLVPVFYLIKKEKAKLSTIGLTRKNIIPAIYLSLTLGVIFAIEGLLINYVKYDGISFNANIGTRFILYSFLLSFATAITEEITFRGYLFTRIWLFIKGEWVANFITSAVWAVLHIPIALFWWKMDLLGLVLFVALTTIFSIGSGYVFARTKNIAAPILLHVLWEWPIILFR